MAKVLGLHGKARGKVGSVVYRTEAGIGTIASEYNPNPRNPRTLAQVAQRSKMNLAGQLSKVTPYAAIAGLASSRRAARSMFVSSVLKAANQDTIEENMTRAVADFVVLSKGVEAGVAFTISGVEDETHATINIDSSASTFSIVGAIVVLYFNGMNGQVMCVTKKVENLALPVIMETGIALQDGDFLVGYVIPIIDKGEDVRVAFGNLSVGSNSFITNFVRTLVNAGAYTRSIANTTIVRAA